MTRVWRLLRGLRLRVTWIAVGWAGAFGMAMFGSKLHGLVEDFVARVRAWFRARITWQGASPDQRARMVEDDHYDIFGEGDAWRAR